MWAVVVAVLGLSVFHLCLGVISICVGVSASIQAEVWMAHSVSPIWSGGFVSTSYRQQCCKHTPKQTLFKLGSSRYLWYKSEGNVVGHLFSLGKSGCLN